MNKLREIREYYYNNGLKIFPLSPNGKTPLDTLSWKYLAEQSIDKKQIMYWFTEVPDANVGLPASMNDLFVIDIDMHGDVNGHNHFKDLLKKVGVEDLDTLCQVTPSGGMHLIFKSDDDLKQVKNVANAFQKDGFMGIDIRTDGYIVVYPSVINGNEYLFFNDDAHSGDTFMSTIKPMPAALKNYILECNSSNVSEISEKFKSGDFFVEGKVIEKGTRDEEIFNYICFLYNNTKLNYTEIKELALAYNRECFDPPLKEKDIEYKVNKQFEKERQKIVIMKI